MICTTCEATRTRTLERIAQRGQYLAKLIDHHVDDRRDAHVTELIALRVEYAHITDRKLRCAHNGPAKTTGWHQPFEAPTHKHVGTPPIIGELPFLLRQAGVETPATMNDRLQAVLECENAELLAAIRDSALLELELRFDEAQGNTVAVPIEDDRTTMAQTYMTLDERLGHTTRVRVEPSGFDSDGVSPEDQPELLPQKPLKPRYEPVRGPGAKPGAKQRNELLKREYSFAWQGYDRTIKDFEAYQASDARWYSDSRKDSFVEIQRADRDFLHAEYRRLARIEAYLGFAEDDYGFTAGRLIALWKAAAARVAELDQLVDTDDEYDRAFAHRMESDPPQDGIRTAPHARHMRNEPVWVSTTGEHAPKGSLTSIPSGRTGYSRSRARRDRHVRAQQRSAA